MTHGDGQIMKDYKAVALALPTIVALALGGAALTAAPAAAEPAPIVTTEVSPAPVVEDASGVDAGDADGTASDGDAGADPVETPADADVPVEPEATESAPAEPEPTGIETAEPAAVPEIVPDDGAAVEAAAPGDPDAGSFSLASPAQGQVFTEFGLTVSGTADFVGRVDVTTPEGVSLTSTLVVPGEWSLDVGFFEGPAGPRRIVVTATDAAGPTVRAVETRDVVFDVPTSPAPTITAPVGPTVTADASSWPDAPEGWGEVTFRGTGVAGSEIDIDLERTDGGDPNGHGHSPIVVQPDGTWAYVDLLQADAGWRVSVRQFVDGVEYISSLPSARVSRDFRLVSPVGAPVTPVAPLPPVETVVVPVPVVASPVTASAVRPASRPALAQTGVDHAGDAALAGLGLLVLGTAAALLGRRRRRV